MRTHHILLGKRYIRVATDYVYPPIPDRSCDWSAVDDGRYEPGEPTGRGETELEAIDDLLEQLEERYEEDEKIAAAEEFDPYAAAGESPFGLPGGGKSL